MDADQLNASIRSVTGGIGWDVVENGRMVDKLDALAASLGKPDYIQNTSEDLSPNLAFTKFLGDAARAVCTQLAEKEGGLGASEENHLFVHLDANTSPEAEPGAADKNLQTLVRNFHGRRLGTESAELERWRFLLKSAYKTSGTAPGAWTAVCVGLITHPDFYLY